MQPDIVKRFFPLTLAVMGLLIIASIIGSKMGLTSKSSIFSINKSKTKNATTPGHSEKWKQSSAWQETFPIGKSVEGKPLTVVRMGTGPKKILVLSGTHGDEYGVEVANQFLDYCRNNKAVIPKGVALFVLPQLNPDGWEKMRRGNAHRVDINRNFPAKWAKNLDPKDDTSLSHSSAGPKPASEPETQALIELLKEERFARVISIHSLGGVIDYDGPGKGLAIAMAKASPAYLVDQTQYSGNSSGSLGNYVSRTYNIPIITIELESDHLERVLDALLVGLRY